MYSSTITQFEEPPKKKATEEASEPTPLPCREEGEQPLIWRNIIVLGILHVIAIYNLVRYAHLAKLGTWIFSPIWGISSGFGVTAGAHRLWAHRSYSAKAPLRIFLAILYCMAGQKYRHNVNGYIWVKTIYCATKIGNGAQLPSSRVSTGIGVLPSAATTIRAQFT